MRYIGSQILLTSLIILDLGNVIYDNDIESCLIIDLMKDLDLEDLIVVIVINSDS